MSSLESGKGNFSAPRSRLVFPIVWIAATLVGTITIMAVAFGGSLVLLV
jgi:hypothetical protein